MQRPLHARRSPCAESHSRRGAHAFHGGVGADDQQLPDRRGGERCVVTDSDGARTPHSQHRADRTNSSPLAQPEVRGVSSITASARPRRAKLHQHGGRGVCGSSQIPATRATRRVEWCSRAHRARSRRVRSSMRECGERPPSRRIRVCARRVSDPAEHVARLPQWRASACPPRRRASYRQETAITVGTLLFSSNARLLRTAERAFSPEAEPSVEHRIHGQVSIRRPTRWVRRERTRRAGRAIGPAHFGVAALSASASNTTGPLHCAADARSIRPCAAPELGTDARAPHRPNRGSSWRAMRRHAATPRRARRPLPPESPRWIQVRRRIHCRPCCAARAASIAAPAAGTSSTPRSSCGCPCAHPRRCAEGLRRTTHCRELHSAAAPSACAPSPTSTTVMALPHRPRATRCPRFTVPTGDRHVARRGAGIASGARASTPVGNVERHDRRAAIVKTDAAAPPRARMSPRSPAAAAARPVPRSASTTSDSPHR